MANSTLQRGVMGLMDDGREDFFETEQSLSSSPIPDVIQKAFLDIPTIILDPTKDALGDLFVDFLGIKSDTEWGKNGKNLQIGGKSEINFNKQSSYKEKWEAEYKRGWTQSLNQDIKNVHHQTQEQAIEDLVRLEIGAMPTEEKNKSLHLSLDLDEKYISDPYHINALRVKKIEEIKATLQKKQDQEITSTSKNSGLLLNMDAHEGQSATSSSGAIFSAG